MSRLCVVVKCAWGGCLCGQGFLCVSAVCTDVSCMGMWCGEGCVPRVGAGRMSGCMYVCPVVMCVPVGVGGAAEGKGAWAASLSSLDRAPEKI